MTSFVALLLLAAVAAEEHDHDLPPAEVEEVIDWDNLKLHHKINSEKTYCRAFITESIKFDYKDGNYVQPKDTTKMYTMCDTPMDIFSPKNNRLLHFHFGHYKNEAKDVIKEYETEYIFSDELVTEVSQEEKLIEYAHIQIKKEAQDDLKHRVSNLPSLKEEYAKYIKEKVKPDLESLETKR